MKKVKIVLTLLLTMSLCWIAPGASKSVNAEDYCGSNYWSVRGLNDKSEEIKFEASSNVTISLTFSNGKKLEKTMPKNDNSNCTNLNFSTPNDVKPLLVYGKSVKVEYKRGNTVVKTEKLTVKRGIAFPTMSVDSDKGIASGTGHPGTQVILSTDLVTSENQYDSLEDKKLKVDAAGKWTYTYTDKEKKKFDEMTTWGITIDTSLLKSDEEVVKWNSPFAIKEGRVNPISAGDQYVTGAIPPLHMGGWSDTVEMRVTFPNKRVVKQALKSIPSERKGNLGNEWSIEVPKDIVLKPQDKVEVQLFSDWLFKKSAKPITVTVGGESKTPTVNYSAHVQNIGWQTPVKDGELAGTSGKGLRVESFRMNLTNLPMSGGIKYATHVENIGWQNAVSDNEISGTTGKSLRMEAMSIKLTGEIAKYYDVYYCTHVQNIGWLDWAKNGEYAGSEGKSLRMEAIEVKLVKKGYPAPASNGGFAYLNFTYPEGVGYSAHVQNIGWQDSVWNGALSGTSGKGLRVEAFKMNMYAPNSGISYATHIQNIGWQNPVSNGEISGTEGRGLRMEAIRVNLTGAVSKYYDVYYRTHVQNYGWLGWAKNGQNAGSEGKALRMEAIEVKLVPKGDPAPQTGASYVLANGQKV